ncbi:MAG: hypothetical protein EYX74_01005 [Desulfobulbaceae bacterium]|nr:MAG: hypothetical protein EYX74_01005 [Desulfobulbaceae bacterium]
MDLIQVKHYLRERRVASLQEIALHFKVEVDTVKPLLEIWVNKGKARRHADGVETACSGCCRCDPASLVAYEWLGK